MHAQASTYKTERGLGKGSRGERKRVGNWIFHKSKKQLSLLFQTLLFLLPTAPPILLEKYIKALKEKLKSYFTFRRKVYKVIELSFSS